MDPQGVGQLCLADAGRGSLQNFGREGGREGGRAAGETVFSATGGEGRVQRGGERKIEKKEKLIAALRTRRRPRRGRRKRALCVSTSVSVLFFQSEEDRLWFRAKIGGVHLPRKYTVSIFLPQFFSPGCGRGGEGDGGSGGSAEKRRGAHQVRARKCTYSFCSSPPPLQSSLRSVPFCPSGSLGYYVRTSTFGNVVERGGEATRRKGASRGVKLF